MSRNELIKKIKNAYEMVISIDGRKFTICDENEKGFSIGEHYKPETEVYFQDAESLANEFVINGKPLAEYAETIVIEDYTGFEE